MKKVFVFALALSGILVSMARADDPKSYSVALAPMRVGTIDLQKGDYQLLIHRDDMTAQLRSMKTGDVIDLPAKVTTADQKYSSTEIHTQDENGVKRVIEIRIGGTAYRIAFQKPS